MSDLTGVYWSLQYAAPGRRPRPGFIMPGTCLINSIASIVSTVHNCLLRDRIFLKIHIDQ